MFFEMIEAEIVFADHIVEIFFHGSKGALDRSQLFFEVLFEFYFESLINNIR